MIDLINMIMCVQVRGNPQAGRQQELKRSKVVGRHMFAKCWGLVCIQELANEGDPVGLKHCLAHIM